MNKMASWRSENGTSVFAPPRILEKENSVFIQEKGM